MRILTYNVNGIRAAVRKGFLDWLKTDPADIICLQELKAQEKDIDKKVFEKLGYQTYLFPAQKKGYSGVGILSRIKPDDVEYGQHNQLSDNEGRVLRADFKELSVISAYFPSGTMGEVRQNFKYNWLDDFLHYVTQLKKKKTKLVICGDYNIAHKEIDIHNPKGNKKSSGFLPEERAWMDTFFKHGFLDGFRLINQEPNQYTWWYQLRPSLRLENKGWRIDYISLTKNLRSNVEDAKILPQIKHSDHCPVVLTFKF
ncbi:MAG: exodeoxyribonuclease III [Chitinophagaceae bacterium]|nr:exodeoxyribonuclease III [Chitinophagaceae bacterium]